MPNKLTIVFRGLLVFHKLSVTGQPSIFEIGILPEPIMVPEGTEAENLPDFLLINPPEHVPRIMTIRNGVLESTTLLQQAIKDTPGIWQLVFDQPTPPPGVTTRPVGATGDKVDRFSPPTPDDFRLIINLANSEFPYGKITGQPIAPPLVVSPPVSPPPVVGTQIDFSQFKVVVRVPSGEFYTKLQSNLLNRQEDPDSNGTISPFGHIAGVVGCDISLNGAGATLVGPGVPAPKIFRFDATDPNVIYEFSNSPPDIAEHSGTGTHFMHYYQLFHPAAKKFDFQNQTGGPGPNPALCGATYIGETDEPLQ